MDLELLPQLRLPFFELLRFRFTLRQPLFDGSDLFGLRIQPSARPLLFQLQISQTLAGLGQFMVVAIAGFLKRHVFFLTIGYLIREILEFGVCKIQDRARSWRHRAPACGTGR